MAVTTVSSSYALLQQPHRLIVGNPCTPSASAIASNDLMFGSGGSDKVCESEGNDTRPLAKVLFINLWDGLFDPSHKKE